MSNVNRLGAALMAAIGVLHLILAPEYLGEETYIGVLFIAGGVVALVLSTRLWRRGDRLDWGLGALISAGMAAGFILSRTAGLPGFHESEWELSGIVSVLAEIGFLGVAALASARAQRSPLPSGRPPAAT